MELSFSGVLAYIISLLITAGIGLLVELLRRKVGIEGLRKVAWQLDQKKDLAMLAVQFVEQAYKGYYCEVKYQKAAEWLAARARERGLRITEDEIKGLIESSLRQIKDEMGEEWAKILQEEETPSEEAG